MVNYMCYSFCNGCCLKIRQSNYLGLVAFGVFYNLKVWNHYSFCNDPLQFLAPFSVF